MENHRLHAKYVFLQVPICDAQLQIVDYKWIFALFIWRQFMEFFQKMYQDDWTARKKKKYSKKLKEYESIKSIVGILGNSN